MQAAPGELIVALVTAFVSVALLVGLGVSRLLSSQSPERRRLKEVSRPAAAKLRSAGPLLTASAAKARAGRTPGSAPQMSPTERRLAGAGYRSPEAPQVFTTVQYGLPVVLGLAGLAIFGFTGRPAWTAAGCGAVLGYLLPGMFLDRKVAKRRLQIGNGLPDVLDLLIVCLEAGNSLDQAVVKATDELSLAYPALAEELRTLTTEMRAGKPRIEAFKNLSRRVKVDDVRALVAMLVQTDRFGTSVSQALRTLADGMRARRRQAAEEAAGKVGVKLVFPLVLCLFPAFFVVVLGPAVLTLLNSLNQMGR